MAISSSASAVWTDLVSGRPTLWVNDRQSAPATPQPALGRDDVAEAAARWKRFAPALAALFPAEVPHGRIESELLEIPHLTARYLSKLAPKQVANRILLKADHALPVAGSVKARGGIYEVLRVAERIALVERILANESDDYVKLAADSARRTFAGYQVLVASTGNLGFAVGTAARALGFAVTVHMSRDAKPWKKDRLRALGASVIEHDGDYTIAVAAARAEAAGDGRKHFVDDERSLDLFLGYSAAAYEIVAALRQRGVSVSTEQPLCVYLPCGVGGAPGGIFFGLRALLGDGVLGFFAEPTASPCMLLRLQERSEPDSSVYDIGLDNRTVADGLAVARASELVAGLVGQQITGAYTVADSDMLRWVARAHAAEGLRLEPSATAGFPGAFHHAWESPLLAPQRDALTRGTHIIWTTGGARVPEEEFQTYLRSGAQEGDSL